MQGTKGKEGTTIIQRIVAKSKIWKKNDRHSLEELNISKTEEQLFWSYLSVFEQTVVFENSWSETCICFNNKTEKSFVNI